METSLILDTLKDALLNRNYEKGSLILHSDLGSQYTSQRYEETLERQKFSIPSVRKAVLMITQV